MFRDFLKLLFGIVFLFFGCKNDTANQTEYTNKNAMQLEHEHPGKKLMEINCYACHNPTTSENSRIAPPMIAIKRHYKTEGVTKKEFIQDIQKFMKNPNPEDAKMRGAVERFGVMPKASYPEATITQIADYIYDFDIEQPDWFEDHFEKERAKDNGQTKRDAINENEVVKTDPELSYEERGLRYALDTKAVLGKHLMGTLQKKGTLDAITFCNEAAYPLTDSMAKINNATIKRVSDKPRNPDNKANSKEKYYIRKFKQVIANNMEPQPIVEESTDNVNFYYPITTNTMCLKCHGTNIEPEVYNTIKQLYPEDKAIGYSENEVRGIWSISFNK